MCIPLWLFVYFQGSINHRWSHSLSSRQRDPASSIGTLLGISERENLSYWSRKRSFFPETSLCHKNLCTNWSWRDFVRKGRWKCNFRSQADRIQLVHKKILQFDDVLCPFQIHGNYATIACCFDLTLQFPSCEHKLSESIQDNASQEQIRHGIDIEQQSLDVKSRSSKNLRSRTTAKGSSNREEQRPWKNHVRDSRFQHGEVVFLLEEHVELHLQHARLRLVQYIRVWKQTRWAYPCSQACTANCF